MSKTKTQLALSVDSRWLKVHKRQTKEGRCGAATLYLVLSYAEAVLNKNLDIPGEDKIHSEINVEWFGAPNGICAAYLSRFFSEIGYKSGSTIDDLYFHLSKGHVLIVDWWDDLPWPGDPERSDPLPNPEGAYFPDVADGHYSIVGGVNPDKNTITLIDPSGSGRDVWDCDLNVFESKWFDYEGMQNNPGLKVAKWFMWVDPSSYHSDVLLL